jgi:hypothetical protein
MVEKNFRSPARPVSDDRLFSEKAVPHGIQPALQNDQYLGLSPVLFLPDFNKKRLFGGTK